MKWQDEVVVKKFGGTSVGSIERIEQVADRIVSDREKGQRPVVVVSAMSGETNRLIGLANQIYPDFRGPAYDMLVASGEQVSTALLAMALQRRGVQAQPYLAFQLGIETDSLYSKARILSIETKFLASDIDSKVVPIVAGFQGVDRNDRITTLGRGGSDTTAVALAVALKQSSCEIYTDVPSVCSADPRLVSGAREIKTLCYEEMMEMSSLGSKVLHGRCVELAAKYNLKIHLRSTFEQREGTWIVSEGEVMEQPLVTAVTHDESVVVVKLFPVPRGPEFPAKLFTQLSDQGVVVDIITQSETDLAQRLAFSVPKEDQAATEECLKGLVGADTEITVLNDLAKLSIVGYGMRNHPGVAAKFFNALSDLGVSMSLVTTSEIKISAVIDKTQLRKAAVGLHEAFGLDQPSVSV